MHPHREVFAAAAWAVAVAALLTSDAAGQMVANAKIPGFAETFGVVLNQRTYPYTAKLAESSAAGNILWPEDQATFTIQIVSNLVEPMQVKGKVDVVAFGTRGVHGRHATARPPASVAG